MRFALVRKLDAIRLRSLEFGIEGLGLVLRNVEKRRCPGLRSSTRSAKP